jgi:Flp pilus assembly protein TadD
LRHNRSTAFLLASALALHGAASHALAAVVDLPADSPVAQASLETSDDDPYDTVGDCALEPVEAQANSIALCSNPVARVLTAPFRALASLFRDDKKDSRRRDAAKTNDNTKTNDNAKTPRTAANTTANTTVPATLSATTPAATATGSATSTTADQPTYAPAPVETSANPEQATNTPLVAMPRQPAANTLAAHSDVAPFTPLVVGVPNDSISQGRALISHGLFEEAISELSVAAATGTNLVEANNLLGLAYDHRGEHVRAQEFYKRALTLAPRDAHVISNLGYSLYLDDRPKDALAKLKLAVTLDPSSAEIYNNLGFVFGKLGKFDDAFRSFTQAGGDLYARVRTASLLEDAGRDRDAIKHYEAARKLDPNSTDVLRRLITLYNRTGQRDKAEAAERSLDKPKGRATTSTTD